MTELKDLEQTKVAIVDIARRMWREGLVRGTAGNISCVFRNLNVMLITPTGVDYERLLPEHISVVDLDGRPIGGLSPSSETFMHLGIYKKRSDVNTVVHTHSQFAAVLSILGHEIPSVHYMVALFGGDKISLTTTYQLYGSQELAMETVKGLGEQYYGIILRNHGAVAVGDKLSTAYSRAVVLEEMATLYYYVLATGQPNLLTHVQMDEMKAKLGTYGLSNGLALADEG
ncbi:class II aldolase/adducin family protein [Alicyclobacillaceae bacterium I2511]|nr:class II aldolase/adducin family protein [Alicyclobacillaceae bacterium I2511]